VQLSRNRFQRLAIPEGIRRKLRMRETSAANGSSVQQKHSGVDILWSVPPAVNGHIARFSRWTWTDSKAHIDKFGLRKMSCGLQAVGALDEGGSNHPVSGSPARKAQRARTACRSRRGCREAMCVQWPKRDAPRTASNVVSHANGIIGHANGSKLQGGQRPTPGTAQ